MRVFIIVLDSLGAGALPDAPSFGDEGAFTLRSLYESGTLAIPNLRSLGIGNIEGLGFIGAVDRPRASFGRCSERSAGKDTTVGHWEIAGLVSEKPLPTYLHGFPPQIIEAFERAVGRGSLVNSTYSGTEVIADYGDEHVRTGKYIVYTSADSVFQIAAHESVIPLDELYAACEKARAILVGEHGVGRVIARPFTGESGAYRRTANRRDFSLPPPSDTMLDLLAAAGRDVVSVGKINDIFASRGVTEAIHTEGNSDGMEKTLEVAGRDLDGLCFVNLVDFDMIYGHRRDVAGYTNALNEFDRFLPSLIERLRPNDALIITADHGCDPAYCGTDHTREYVPLLVYGEKLAPEALGTRRSFSDVGATVLDLLGVKNTLAGDSFASLIKGNNRA